jgi:hypothetical protein
VEEGKSIEWENLAARVEEVSFASRTAAISLEWEATTNEAKVI